LLADADTAHVGTALTVLLMSGLVIIGLVMRPRGRVLRIASWVSVGLVAICALNGALLYLSAR
jgi:cation:H+ antiporter